jgi:hypothetical protein
MIDRELFCELCKDPPKLDRGIGTYQEKSIHSILKHCCDPDRSHHEVSFLGYVCDVKKDNRIFEIQTSGFGRMSKKIEAYLEADCQVDVIYPVPAVRRLMKIDSATGELVTYGKARAGRPSDILQELDGIKNLFGRAGLTFYIVLLDVNEIRIPAIKRGRETTRLAERIPLEHLGEIKISKTEDLFFILPELPKEFTAAQFSKLLSLRGRKSGRALDFLVSCGALTREKKGRAYIYKKAGRK